jgi:hypothetical protein
MKLKLFDILNSKEILESLLKQEFSAKLSYIIQRNIKVINSEFDVVNESRMELFRKYGEKVDIGENQYRITQENVNKYVSEMNELLSQEIELNIIQIPISEFDFKISPEKMSFIEWMFNFDIE